MKTRIVAAVLILYLTATSAWAQTRAKLHVVYPAISGINAPLWYATEQNLFQKYGLEVELIYIPTALQVTRVVLTGDSQIAFSGGAPVVNAVLSGADLVFIGGVANVPAFYMMALPEIKSVADLKGKTVGVTRFGSSTDFALRYLVQKNGFNPDKDLNILQLGGMPELGRLTFALALPVRNRCSTWPKPASIFLTLPSSPGARI
jgi:NitT/TauT family transport system substrate-binding protein